MNIFSIWFNHSCLIHLCCPWILSQKSEIMGETVTSLRVSQLFGLNLITYWIIFRFAIHLEKNQSIDCFVYCILPIVYSTARWINGMLVSFSSSIDTRLRNRSGTRHLVYSSLPQVKWPAVSFACRGNLFHGPMNRHVLLLLISQILVRLFYSTPVNKRRLSSRLSLSDNDNPELVPEIIVHC